MEPATLSLDHAQILLYELTTLSERSYQLRRHARDLLDQALEVVRRSHLLRDEQACLSQHLAAMWIDRLLPQRR